jgi:hypothetical protein
MKFFIIALLGTISPTTGGFVVHLMREQTRHRQILKITYFNTMFWENVSDIACNIDAQLQFLHIVK